MNQRRHIAALVVALPLPLLLTAACTVRVEGQVSAATTAASSSSAHGPGTAGKTPSTAAPTPTDEQLPGGTDFTADTSDRGGPAQTGSAADPAGQLHVSGIRVVSQQGYTRLVIDLTSHGVPAWTARYTEASGPGGGPVQIQGKAFLRVALQTGADPGNQGQNDIRLSPGPVAEAKTTGSFEGSEEVLIGMRDGETPFRAFALTDPGRIVIDVRPAG
jgi:hypothetical protein